MFKNPQYNSLKVVALIAVVVVAGTFIWKGVANKSNNLSSNVITPTQTGTPYNCVYPNPPMTGAYNGTFDLGSAPPNYFSYSIPEGTVKCTIIAAGAYHPTNPTNDKTKNVAQHTNNVVPTTSTLSKMLNAPSGKLYNCVDGSGQFPNVNLYYNFDPNPYPSTFSFGAGDGSKWVCTLSGSTVNNGSTTGSVSNK